MTWAQWMVFGMSVAAERYSLKGAKGMDGWAAAEVAQYRPCRDWVAVNRMVLA